MTDPKPRPGHAVYLRVLRGMSPEARLRKAFELSAFARALFRTGLRHRFPHLPEPEFERLVRDRLERCHNEEAARDAIAARAMVNLIETRPDSAQAVPIE